MISVDSLQQSLRKAHSVFRDYGNTDFKQVIMGHMLIISMLHNTRFYFYFIAKLDCISGVSHDVMVTGVMMSWLLLLGHGHFYPLPLPSTVITWLRESPINPQHQKYLEKLLWAHYIEFHFSPFFPVRALLFICLLFVYLFIY